MATQSVGSAIETTSKRVEQLNRIESDIANVLEFAAESLVELSKDYPKKEVVDDRSTMLFDTLRGIERGLRDHINYLGEVSTSSPHMQSIYGAQKDLSITREKEAYLREKLEQTQSQAMADD